LCGISKKVLLLYRRDIRKNALTLFYMWKNNAKNADIKEITEVEEMFDLYEIGIRNAMITGANNARTERLLKFHY
jgi:hypothetical protein